MIFLVLNAPASQNITDFSIINYIMLVLQHMLNKILLNWYAPFTGSQMFSGHFNWVLPLILRHILLW